MGVDKFLSFVSTERREEGWEAIFLGKFHRGMKDGKASFSSLAQWNQGRRLENYELFFYSFFGPVKRGRKDQEQWFFFFLFFGQVEGGMEESRVF